MNITELLEVAKKNLQSGGQILPTLSVELCEEGRGPTKGTMTLAGLPEYPTLQEHILHMVGHVLAEKYPTKSIATLCLLLQLQQVRFSEDPSDIFEALVLQALCTDEALSTPRMTATVIEIIRSGAGVDFLVRKEDEIDNGTLLSCFEGFKCERSNDEETEPAKQPKKDKKAEKKAKKSKEKAGKSHE